MDSTTIEIGFDEDGLCNFCRMFEQRLSMMESDSGARARKLENLKASIQRSGRRREYDCIVGLSGGVDSSYALMRAVDIGLRPLAVHMDNGWDSELAQSNIANLVTKLDVDLRTYVINWSEYRSLMQAFFDADVIDVELLYDNAMLAVNYQIAREYKIKFILAGSNTHTEGMSVPGDWTWYKWDQRNIKSLARSGGLLRLRSFPSIGTLGRLRMRLIHGVRWISFLDYFDYIKNDAVRELSSRFGFRSYPYKHYESIFTRFYQGHILPEKFGVDKRLLHLSTLIIANQMTRQEAVALLSETPYRSREDLEEDITYFLKKMQWSPCDLETYLMRPRHEHDEFGSEVSLHRLLLRLKAASPALGRIWSSD